MSDATDSKNRWRRVLRARRRVRVLRGDTPAVSTSVARLVASLGVRHVASYVPMPEEPNPGVDAEFLPRLFSADGPLPVGSWGSGPLESPRPKWPSQPRRPADPRGADLVLVPALAVDISGARLGKGGGWYDRTLSEFSAPIYAVVWADEVYPAHTLPRESHDYPLDGCVTEEGFRSFHM